MTKGPRTGAVLCALVAAIANWPSSVHADGCPTPREAGISPQITVQPNTGQPHYYFNTSRNQLTALMRQANNGTNHGTVLGLTLSNYAPARSHYHTRTLRRGGLYCHYIKDYTMDLTIADLSVYIASEYRQGTCQAQVITTHENEHVRVHQSVVLKYAPIMREALLKRTAVAFAGYSPDAETVVNRALNDTITSVLSQMMAEQRRGNGYIDTQDSYKRTAQRCSKW